ncbi:MAG: hypothetical protein Q9190_004185 [Brigantiaea leucoxantha]
MNPNNFQHMGMPGPGTQTNVPQVGQPNGIQHHIWRTLSQQQIPPGWQGSVSPQNRMTVVCQLVTALRILHNAINDQHSVQVAITFETKAFLNCPDKQTYETTYRNKLREITETRRRQIEDAPRQYMQNNQGQPMNMAPHQMQMHHLTQGQNQNQGQTPFQHGMQNGQTTQMMQATGMAMQQQQQHQQMGRPQAQQPPMGHTQSTMPQSQPNSSQQMAKQMAQQMSQFTQEEIQNIMKMAGNMMQNTPQHAIDTIQNNLRSVSQEQKDALARQGIDPLTHFFRNQAIRRYLQIQRGSQGVGGPQAMGLMNGQTQPISQNPVRNQGQPAPGTQGQQAFEPAFDQIIGQQQDALRSQEAGQVVVPASNGQPNMNRANQAQPPAQQQINVPSAGNRPSQGQNPNQSQSQQFWNTQQPPEVNQTSGVTGNTQAPGFGNATPVQNPILQGQVGGLNDQMSRAASQNPIMPTLNQASAPPGQPQPTPKMWSQNRTPQLNQPNPQNQPMGPQNLQRGPPQDNMQQRPQPSFPANVPPQIQQQLANMSEENKRSFFLSIQRRQNVLNQQQQQRQQQLQQAQRSAQMANIRGPEGTAPMPQQSNHSSQPFPPIPGKANAPQPPITPNMAGPQTPFSQQAPATNQSVIPQQRQQPQLSQPQRPGQPPSIVLTEEQTRKMDAENFPSGILNSTSPLSQTPKDVQTWGQLMTWVQQHASTLPPGSLPKLKSLQVLHYQNLRKNLSARRPQPPGLSAPFAQMVPTTSNIGAQMPNLTGPIPLAPPSTQEIQALRARIPQFMAATDDQLRGMILRQRQIEMDKARMAQNPYPMSGIQSRMTVPNNQPPSAQQPQQTQSRPQAVQSTKSAPAPKDQVVKQSPKTRSTAPVSKQQQPSKGVKRSSNDEVVEVPNPNIAQTQGHKPTLHSASAPSQTLDQQKVRQDAQRLLNAPRSSIHSQTENQNRVQIGTEALGPEETSRRDARLKQLTAEVSSSVPPRKLVPMTTQAREEMVRKLQEIKPLINRMEQSLPLFFRVVGDEDTAIRLIKARHLLKPQYRDGQVISDNFTITHDELDRSSNDLKQYFQFIMNRLSKNNANGQLNQQVVQQPQAHPPQQERATPLSAANLQEQQNALQAARHASVHQKGHAKHSNQTPAAPTTSQPPFPFGGPQSPHGVPQAYGPMSFPADKLTLPNKRRKNNAAGASAASTPAQAQGTPAAKSSPLATKVASPEVQKVPAPAVTTLFRCPVTTCQASIKGFNTQADLDQHRNDTHMTKEPMAEDPVEYCLVSMRQALGLDEEGKRKPQPKDKEAIEAPKMKTSASSQSYAVVKTEASTPMGRNLTQPIISPSANLLKTPQPTHMKTPASDVKSTPGREVKAKASKEAVGTPQETAPSPFDPWSCSSISPEDITSAWSSLADMQNLSSFSKIQGFTPSSTLSSLENKSEKNSPRPSDISENDAVKINIDVSGTENGKNESWMPAEWFEDSLYSEMNNLNFDGDGIMQGMDWDFFGDSADTVMVDIDGDTADAGKGKSGVKGDGPSEEWLKIYAPERTRK